MSLWTVSTLMAGATSVKNDSWQLAGAQYQLGVVLKLFDSLSDEGWEVPLGLAISAVMVSAELLKAMGGNQAKPSPPPQLLPCRSLLF